MYKVSAKSERVIGELIKNLLFWHGMTLYVYVCMYNWDSLHARLNCHCKTWNYTKKDTKGLKYTGNKLKRTYS